MTEEDIKTEIILNLWLQFAFVSTRNCCGKQVLTHGGLVALAMAEEYLVKVKKINAYGMPT